MVVVATLVAAILALPPATHANGQGVTVYLGYLPEVSNWGAYEATGQAYVNAGEGRAHVTVDHMIHDPAIRYEVWLVRADDRDTLFSVGTFEVDDSGHADVELFNPDLTPAEFRFLVISAEPAADDDPRPDARRTIAGVFPNAMARIPSSGDVVGFDGIWTQPAEGATAAVTEEAAPSGPAEATVAPSPPRLPVTGGRKPTYLLALLTSAGLASLGLVVAGVRRQRAAERARCDAAKCT